MTAHAERVVVCKGCGVPKKKIRVPRPEGKAFWRDTNGYLWNGNTCRDCLLVVKRQRRRKAGIKERDEVREPRVLKARAGERLVKAWFEGKGFEVRPTHGPGPDLVCTAGRVTLTVEVKTVVASTVKEKVYWKVGEVKPLRRQDDLIAIVLPSGRVHLEDMSSHLLKCNASFERTVTALVREDYEIEARRVAISA